MFTTKIACYLALTILLSAIMIQAIPVVHKDAINGTEVVAPIASGNGTKPKGEWRRKKVPSKSKDLKERSLYPYYYYDYYYPCW